MPMLQPEMFQKDGVGPSAQMIDRASALDEAPFRMHEDLYRSVDEVHDLFRLASESAAAGAH
jgi:hypothetical protein